MITYKTKSQYFDVENGEEITKKNVEKNYYKITKTKHITKIDETNERGYEHITININYWWQCRRKPKQLTII